MNGIIFLISFLVDSVLEYRANTDFYMLILYENTICIIDDMSRLCNTLQE